MSPYLPLKHEAKTLTLFNLYEVDHQSLLIQRICLMIADLHPFLLSFGHFQKKKVMDSLKKHFFITTIFILVSLDVVKTWSAFEFENISNIKTKRSLSR